MNDIPNIALTGKFRSGKDSVGRYLCANYGYTRFAFGDELKRYAHELFDVDSASKPRELYQWFGQTMRQRDPDVWVRKCFEAIARCHYNRVDYEEDPDEFRAVITDLRQPNECDRCRSEGFVIIRINCPDDIRLARARSAGDDFTDADIAHETERHVDIFTVDYEIDNSGALSELHAQIDAIMEAIGIERG